MPTSILGYHNKSFDKYKEPSNLKEDLMDKKIKIGIELEWEFDNPDNNGYYDDDDEWIEADTSDYYRERFIKRLNDAGLYPTTYYRDLNNRTLDFTLEEDGSLWEDSCEFVTRPMNFHPDDLSDMGFMKQVLDILNDNYDVYRKNSGMHVHINQDDFYPNNIMKSKLCQILFCSLMNKNEFWDDLYKWSEREDEGHIRNYAAPRELIEKYNIETKISLLAKYRNQYGIANIVSDYWWKSLNRCENKYSATHKTNYDTIEIRIFNSTTSWETIINRLNTIYKMIEFCRTLTDEILDKGIEIKLNDIQWEDFYNNRWDKREIRVGTVIYSVTDAQPFLVMDYEDVTQTFRVIRLRDKIDYIIDTNFRVNGLEDFGKMFSFDKIKGGLRMKTITEIVNELGLKYQKDFNGMEDGKKILFLLNDKTNGIYNRIYTSCNTGLGGFVRADGENHFTGIQEQFISKLKKNNTSWDEVQLYLIHQYQATIIGEDNDD